MFVNLKIITFVEPARIARRTDTCVKQSAREDFHMKRSIRTSSITRFGIIESVCVSNAISVATVRKTATRTHVPMVANSDTGSSTISSCPVAKRAVYLHANRAGKDSQSE
jgi:hypothetical protein